MRYTSFLIGLLCSCQVFAMELEEDSYNLQRITIHDSAIKDEDKNPLAFDRSVIKEFIKFRNKNFTRQDNGKYEVIVQEPGKPDIKKKFLCPFYVPKENQDEEIEDKLLQFIQAYPTDPELVAMLSRSLIKKDKNLILNAIDWMAQVVLKAHSDETDAHDFFLHFYTQEYIKMLNSITSNHVNLSPHIKNINTFFINQRGHADTFIKECNFVLSSINLMNQEFSKQHDNTRGNIHTWADAFFLFIVYQLNGCGKSFLIKKVSHDLYNTMKKVSCPPSIKLRYAEHCLMPERRYAEACSLYQSVLCVENEENDFFHTSYHYKRLAGLLISTSQFQEALEANEKALIFNSCSTEILKLQWNIAFSKILSGDFNNDVAQTLKRFMEISQEGKVRYSKCYRYTISVYPYVLDKLGRTKELEEFFLSQQQAVLQKAFEREKKKGAIAKKGIEAQRALDAKRMQQKQLEQRQQKEKLKKYTTTTSTTSITSATYTASTTSRASWNNSYDYTAGHSIEKYTPEPQKKEKKKTRNTANEQKNNIEQEKVEITINFTTISDLTSNKHAWKTFNKLFEVYPKKDLQDPICFTNATISLTDINWLFKAFAKGKEVNATPDSAKEKKTKTGIDPSRGKGSHKIATIDLGDEMAKTVLTLTNATGLKEYQIERLRNAFIKAGVFPDTPAIIEQLKAIKREMDLSK